MDFLRTTLQQIVAIPQKYPGAASIITGIGALALIIAGLANLSQLWGLIIPGLALMAFVVYAGVETKGFRAWPPNDPGHPIARYVGPLMIAAAFFFSVIGAVLIVFVGCAVLYGLFNAG